MGPWLGKRRMSEGTNTWICSNWIHDLECHPSQKRSFRLGKFPHFLRLLKMSTWLRSAWTLGAISDLRAHKRSRPLKDLNFSFNSAMQMRPKTLFHHLLMSYKCKHYEDWKGYWTWQFKNTFWRMGTTVQYVVACGAIRKTITYKMLYFFFYWAVDRKQ